MVDCDLSNRKSFKDSFPGVFLDLQNRSYSKHPVKNAWSEYLEACNLSSESGYFNKIRSQYVFSWILSFLFFLIIDNFLRFLEIRLCPPPPVPPLKKKEKSFITDFYSGSNLQYFFKQKFETTVLLSSILAKKRPYHKAPS